MSHTIQKVSLAEVRLCSLPSMCSFKELGPIYAQVSKLLNKLSIFPSSILQEAALVLLQNLYEELGHMVDQRPEGRNYGSGRCIFFSIDSYIFLMVSVSL
jgi:hypothetical protein